MNWPRSIILAFVLFAGLVITMVVISMKHEVNLVAHNYYEEELAYQDQIDRIQNFNDLADKPTIIRRGEEIIVTFPIHLASEIQSGEIHFFRPSDNSIDKKIELKLDQAYSQSFPTNGLGKGLWKTKLRWKSNDKEYFSEQRFVL
ncbi:FixH family protein [Reichenbachiella carrageenanivorans]|uniref:FixH family protein n=1 Tax=Reichenbachiella carrageenanivorans TaxID=2979869 RepID=A0ABY6CX86_9BACT|nr:FixH family protein [Reichenbachiella carrageenanivorans]UXX78488.1 FixH family protein [Reichenbachiella carrageenanivorans]